jgi:hypothetical protein
MTPHREPRTADLLAITDPFEGGLDGPSDSQPWPRVPEPAQFAPAPTRARVRARRWRAFLLALTVNVALVLVLGLRAGVGLGTLRMMAGVWGPVLLGLGLLWSAVFGLRSTRAVAMGVGASVALFLGAAPFTDGAGSGSPTAMAACGALTMLLLTTSAALGVTALRHAFVQGAPWRTAALGVSAGIVGGALLRLHCANDAWSHVLVGHVLVGHGAPMVIAAAVLGAFAARFTRT